MIIEKFTRRSIHYIYVSLSSDTYSFISQPSLLEKMIGITWKEKAIKIIKQLQEREKIISLSSNEIGEVIEELNKLYNPKKGNESLTPKNDNITKKPKIPNYKTYYSVNREKILEKSRERYKRKQEQKKKDK